MYDYDLLIIMKIGEVFVDESVPPKVQELRLKALGTLRWQIEYYKKLGYVEKLLQGITEKRIAMIMKTTTKTEMDKVMTPRAPRYDGDKFVPDEYHILEEEMIGWSQASLRVPLSSIGHKRYMELVMELFPEERENLKLRGVSYG